VLDSTLNKLTVIFTVHVPCSLYHCTCTDLNPSFWISGTAYPVMHLHFLNTRIYFYVLVQTCCGAPLIMLGYVCKHVYIYVSWNYSCCQRLVNLFLKKKKNWLLLQNKTVHFLHKVTDNNSSLVLCFMKRNLLWQTVGSCQNESDVLDSLSAVATL
jgi:hypothetical protein